MTNTPEPIQQVIERLHELLREYQDAALVEAQNPMLQIPRANATRAYRRYANYAADTAPRLAQALTAALAEVERLQSVMNPPAGVLRFVNGTGEIVGTITGIGAAAAMKGGEGADHER